MYFPHKNSMKKFKMRKIISAFCERVKRLVNVLVWFISNRWGKLKWKINVPVINHNRIKLRGTRNIRR
jgi:hypothetical protein